MWCACVEQGHMSSTSKLIWLTTTPVHCVQTAFNEDRLKTIKASLLTLFFMASLLSLNLLQFFIFKTVFLLFCTSCCFVPRSVLCYTSFSYFLPPPASPCTSCHFSSQIQRLPAAVLDWRPFSRCSKQLSSALHHSVDSLLRSSNSLVNNNWGLGLSLDNIGEAVLGGSRSDLAKFARSQHSVDKATFAIHEISCTYYR